MNYFEKLSYIVGYLLKTDEKIINNLCFHINYTIYV